MRPAACDLHALSPRTRMPPPTPLPNRRCAVASLALAQSAILLPAVPLVLVARSGPMTMGLPEVRLGQWAGWLRRGWSALARGGGGAEPEEDLSADGPTARRIRAELAALVPLSNLSFSVGQTGDGRGRGLFATVPIAAGCYLLDYEGELLDEAGFASRYPDATFADYTVAVARDDGSAAYVDGVQPIGAASPTNVARFMNHQSDEPNCAMWTLSGGSGAGGSPPRLMLFARLDVAAGAELVWDYGASYWQGREADLL